MTPEAKAKHAEYQRTYRERHPELVRNRTRNSDLKRAYGITLEERNAMEEAQGGTCAICRKTQEKSLHVDHDHATGKVRALLCDSCNLGLGKFRDDPDLLAAAAQYVYAHRPLVMA